MKLALNIISAKFYTLYNICQRIYFCIKEETHNGVLKSVQGCLFYYLISRSRFQQTLETLVCFFLQLTVFLPFFVNLQLPYSVVRGELAVIQANIFNYLGQDHYVSIQSTHNVTKSFDSKFLKFCDIKWASFRLHTVISCIPNSKHFLRIALVYTLCQFHVFLYVLCQFHCHAFVYQSKVELSGWPRG